MLADLLRRGIQRILFGPISSIIDSSTVSTASAYSNQRKVDRCQNGVLWTFFSDLGTGFAAGRLDVHAAYSTDNGETWTNLASNLLVSPSTNNYVLNFSVFIDLDDYCHIVLKDTSDGFIYYYRGIPNAGRTAWTWSAATQITEATTLDYPDVVAHRRGTGWTVHIVCSNSNSLGSVRYNRIDITSGGVITRRYGTSDLDIGGNYGIIANHWPSIDFQHTGDGKTGVSDTPDLYVAWSAGATGAGKGIRFKKAIFGGSDWTWGTEREIDSTRFVDSNVAYWLTGLFDGTRFVMVGELSGTSVDVMLYQRDADDTTTTTQTLISITTSANRLYTGSMTYDNLGNIYLFGRHHDEAASFRDFVYHKWTRFTTILDDEVVIDPNITEVYASAKRGYSEDRIEWVYTANSPSWNVTFGGIDT